MGSKDYFKDSGIPAVEAHKKPYSRPVFQEFGKLNRITQGAGGGSADGSSNMGMSTESIGFTRRGM